MKPTLLLINFIILLLITYFWFDFQITVKYALPLDDLLAEKLIANTDFYFWLVVAEFTVYLLCIAFRRFYFGIILTLLLLKLWTVAQFFYRIFSLQATDYVEIFQNQWVYLYFILPLLLGIFSFILLKRHIPAEQHKNIPYKHYIFPALLLCLNILFIPAALFYVDDLGMQEVGNEIKTELIYEINQLIFIAVVNLIAFFVLLFTFIRKRDKH
ncbi:hypothetical protein HYE59_10860 [Aggregatibacter actinomycetemcomitans]|uniref:hypothetical protein n=1 Tax=Aggregatibacter actinomycetemcomitans TaxID=714 RepID=UPI00197B5727|nr:hypothetical protein [Aggregatibacter actinomycetemcomitans]MBN6078007.1 hypothetical protein [Aggregatibacter actinomycetemcomitans]